MLAQAIRRTVVVPLAGAFLMLLAGAADACVSRYHDNRSNQSADFDYVDDIARKTLDGPLVKDPLAKKATLTIEGSAYGCTGTGATFALTLNGATISRFNCSAFGWFEAEFHFEYALLQPGTATNTFALVDLDQTWNTGIYLEVDTNSTWGRSTIYANGTYVPGELIWTLDAPGLVCTPQP
ncbi:MAG TPA: hypothetical protein VNA20_04525 [Frankiaceae bacterium]|nr:hypothetical protein [Frankiaceae bacterium]